MKNASLFLLIIIYGFYSCQNNDDYFLENVERYLNGRVDLILDDSTSIDFIKTFYILDNDKELLLHLNQFKNQIQVFDLASGMVENEIAYPTREPYGIKIAQGISAVSLDSIFVFMPLTIRGSILIDSDGKLINRYMPSKEKDFEKSLINHTSFGAMPTLIKGNKLSFIQLPLFDVLNPSNINSDFYFEVMYDIESNEVSFNSFSGFPDFYKNKIWPSQDISISRTIDKFNREVYSWKFLDYLIVESNGEVEYKEAKSEYIKNEVVPFNMIPNKNQDMERIIESDKYYGVYYDSYRDLYYRTVQFAGLYDKNGIPKEMDGLRGFSVIVLDGDFNKLKEVRFPGGIYNIYRAFVGKSGLYLPKNNIMNPEMNEDILSIDVFDFLLNE